MTRPEPVMPTSIHLRPTAELAERVLLPGDPGRALALAQTLISEPRMFNHHRGLWGYTGAAFADGAPLTIQATGMGGPSAAIVLAELIALGARRAIRVGTCGALDPELALGEHVVARESICGDGASRALGAGERVAADPDLVAALARAAPAARVGTIVSVDLFYDAGVARAGENTSDQQPSGKPRSARAALAVEMEAAALFALGAREDILVACILTVSDVFNQVSDERTRIDDQALLTAAEAMGAIAVAALAV